MAAAIGPQECMAKIRGALLLIRLPLREERSIIGSSARPLPTLPLMMMMMKKVMMMMVGVMAMRMVMDDG